MLTLINVIDTWIKNSKFKKHFSIIDNTVADYRLTWIKCECVNGITLPPTPKYDIIIADTALHVWEQKSGKTIEIKAIDPEIFEKLSNYLDNSH